MLKRVLAGLFVAILTSGAAVAGPLEDGYAAYGRGDYAQAVKWWRVAAAQSDADAQTILGHMYYAGQGVTQDYKEAVKWWHLAADQGYANAQFNLGVMYANGNGVPTDEAEAVKWYRIAANQGHAGGQHNLGIMYANGQGVPQDFVLAHMWFNLAAAQGNSGAVESREMAANKMTRDQVAEAQRLARDWKPSP